MAAPQVSGVEKRCPRCGDTKPIECFAKNRGRRDGRQAFCRPCGVAASTSYRKRNAESVAAYQKQYRAEHAERYRDLHRKWISERPGYHRERESQKPGDASQRSRRWAKKNLEKVYAANSAYRAKMAAQTIPLSSEQRAQIAAIYREAAVLSRTTGVPHHVDHIVPLNSEVVCGLHVPWNLRAIHARLNIQKSNKLLAEAA